MPQDSYNLMYGKYHPSKTRKGTEVNFVPVNLAPNADNINLSKGKMKDEYNKSEKHRERESRGMKKAMEKEHGKRSAHKKEHDHMGFSHKEIMHANGICRH